MATSIRITFQGSNNIAAALNKTLEDHVKDIAPRVEQSLKSFTPVRTGRARGGWNTKIKKDTFEIDNQVPYIGYLERGTSKMKAANNDRGIIGPALKPFKGKI